MSNYAPMTAPAQSGGSSKPKNPNLQLVPMGMQPAIIYSVVNIGTHAGEYQGKPNKSNKVKISFEFPQHRQLFYVDDTELKPSSLMLDFTYSVAKNKKTMKKTKLLDFIEGLFGPLQESNYLTFDVSSILDMKVFATVQHYTKQDGKIGAKIVNVSPFNPQLINPDTIQRTNPLARYHIGMGFQCPEFASLYYFLRQEIKDSEEGKAYAATGGKFVKFKEDTNELIYDDESNTYTQAPAIPMGKMVMTNPQYTYESMKQAGWTDDALISAGHAYREAVVQQPTPVPMPAQLAPQPIAPQGIPSPIVGGAPQMPYQAVPAIPQAPVFQQIPIVPAQPVFEMIDQTITREQYNQAGWTDELLIQHGKARMNMPVVQMAPPVPQVPTAPPVPAVPQMPQAPQPVYQAPVQQMAPPMPAPPQDAATMFAQTPAMPVQNLAQPQQAVPMPQAPQMPPAPISSFQQASPPVPGNISDEEIDDLPF